MKYDTMGLFRVTYALCIILGIGRTYGEVVKLNSSEDFEKKVLAEKNAWLIAGLESDCACPLPCRHCVLIQQCMTNESVYKLYLIC